MKTFPECWVSLCSSKDLGSQPNTDGLKLSPCGDVGFHTQLWDESLGSGDRDIRELTALREPLGGYCGVCEPGCFDLIPSLCH